MVKLFNTPFGEIFVIEMGVRENGKYTVYGLEILREGYEPFTVYEKIDLEAMVAEDLPPLIKKYSNWRMFDGFNF